MPSPPVTTWADTTNGVRRPGLSDFNAVPMTDDAENPPNPNTDPTSALLNLLAYLHISVGAMISNASISVNAGASPTLAFVVSANPNVTIVSGTITLTRNSVGNYTLSWPAGTFPPQVMGDCAFLNSVLAAHNYSIGVVRATANSVQVTTTQDGVLTDLSFTVDIG